MFDRFGRNIDYLRISITDRCNLKCIYCMPEKIGTVPMKEILTYEEIALVATEAAALGISKIKITGGEPLVRKNACTLIRMLKEIKGIEQVTLTTNGLLLEENCGALKNAGIDAVNISIDTLDRNRYIRITGSDGLDAALRGMRAAIGSGIRVKINAVSLDMQDMLSVAELAKEYPVDVRFIEMMPIGMGKSFQGMPHDELIPKMLGHFKGAVPDDERHGNGPAVYYKLPGASGCIGFISAIHGCFCEKCNRIRLTSMGYIKSCLSYDTGVDLKEILRSGLEKNELSKALQQGIKRCICLKPASHAFSQREGISEKNGMSFIGG